jgi:hypothetical protein
LGCVYAAWLIFIDPTYLALNDNEPLLIAALTLSIAATFLGAAYSAWAK